MHLVDAHRTVAVGNGPVGVAPFVIQRPDHRSSLRSQLHPKPERIGLGVAAALRVDELVLVRLAFLRVGRDALPDARLADRLQREPRTPIVEVARDRDFFRVRRPDGEPNPVAGDVGTEVFPGALQFAVRELLERGGGGVGVGHGLRVASAPSHGNGSLAAVPNTLAHFAVHTPITRVLLGKVDPRWMLLGLHPQRHSVDPATGAAVALARARSHRLAALRDGAGVVVRVAVSRRGASGAVERVCNRPTITE